MKKIRSPRQIKSTFCNSIPKGIYCYDLQQSLKTVDPVYIACQHLEGTYCSKLRKEVYGKYKLCDEYINSEEL
jgi:hypothetical protein